MTHRISRFAATLLFAFSTLFILSSVTPAEAVNCSSVCNQVRRACTHSAKGAWKAARIQCEEDRNGCHTACIANADTCESDCGDDVECQLDCINCEDNCDLAAIACKDTARTARDGMRTLCDDFRGTCRDVCEDPIDRACVRTCTNGEHGCRADAKKVERQCKKGCAPGNAKKGCMRTCRKDNNLDQQQCEDVATLCYAECARVDLTPTTAVE